MKTLDYIESSTNLAIELETLLTNTKALAPENGGNGEMQKALVLKKWLVLHGLDNISFINAPDSRVEGGMRPNMILTLEGKSNEHTLWFISHLDVVPVGEATSWQTPPWTLVKKEGRLYGRGTEDNQQGLVSSVIAALSLKQAGILPEYTVKLLFCADEEVGSTYGVNYLLVNECPFKKQDIIIIPDGGDSEGVCIEIAEKNLLWLRFDITGKQAHASRPEGNTNAYLASCDLLMRVHNLQRIYCNLNEIFDPPYSTFSPTYKEAGSTNYNTIACKDVSGVDCRILPCYDIETIQNAITVQAKCVEEIYNVRVSITKVQSASSPATKETSIAVKLLSNSIKAIKQKNAKLIGIGGGTVAAGLRKAGYENCVVWSTLDEMAHKENEYCVIKNLIEDAKVMSYTMTSKI